MLVCFRGSNGAVLAEPLLNMLADGLKLLIYQVHVVLQDLQCPLPCFVVPIFFARYRTRHISLGLAILITKVAFTDNITRDKARVFAAIVGSSDYIAKLSSLL